MELGLLRLHLFFYNVFILFLWGLQREYETGNSLELAQMGEA